MFLSDMIGEHIGRYRCDEGYVFTACGGGPVRHHNFMSATRRAVSKARFAEGLRFHHLPTPAPRS